MQFSVYNYVPVSCFVFLLISFAACVQTRRRSCCYTERIPVSLCFYVKQKSEICLHHKGHIAVHLGAIFDETGSGVLMIADEQFLFSLSKLSRSKEVAYKREEKSYFSLPLFFFLRFSLNEVGEKNWERRTRYYHLVAMKFETKTHDLLSLSFCERAATVWTNQMTRQYFCSSGALVLIRNDNFRPLPGFTYECDYFVPLWKMF